MTTNFNVLPHEVLNSVKFIIERAFGITSKATHEAIKKQNEKIAVIAVGALSCLVLAITVSSIFTWGVVILGGAGLYHTARLGALHISHKVFEVIEEGEEGAGV